MARKVNPELDSNRDLEHERQLARYLAVAFIAQSHGIGMDTLARSINQGTFHARHATFPERKPFGRYRK